MYKVLKYSEKNKSQWNRFLDTAKNSSFLFDRDFMEYHSDRFIDHSVIVYDNDHIIGMIPANISDNCFYSHQGLTYGGIIVNRESGMKLILGIIYNFLKYLNDSAIPRFIFKPIPRIYNEIPSDEIDWVMTILKANLFRRDTTFSIDSRYPIKYQERRARSIKKCAKLNPVVKCEAGDGFDLFWNNVLEPNLLVRHGLIPVHRCSEIKMLAQRFGENIKQYNIYLDDRIMAGTTLFLTKTVVHAQYIASTEEGRENGCLDFLFDFLIKQAYSKYQYFDFGNCNEENGTRINFGLMDWKEGFGARAISHDFYEINTSNYLYLKNVNT